ncbi:MAG: AAA family ATPase [Elusimicrobiales bacterium]|nr:AAA family ATPase [Elusimicrobiales bacterium]
MESIVFFGKGGIGKSTIAANFSVLLAAAGRKVLHVGCDPKRDSTLSLAGRRIKPFSDGGFAGAAALDGAVHKGVKGIDCIEAGGPQAGVGCAGAGIGAMLDAIRDSDLLDRNGYDTIVFDVLGDVVCGGFAAPLRRGFTSKAVIVVSEELLSLYAANNLVAMINNYARNGVFLAGLAVNAKDISAVRQAEEFARSVNTRVLGVIPRDPAVGRAEKARKPVVLLDPRSAAAGSLAKLAGAIVSARKLPSPPRMMSDGKFEAFTGGGAEAAESRAGAGRSGRPVPAVSPPALLEGSGFAVTGLLGGQVVCSWKKGADACKIFVAPLSEIRTGMTPVGDWAFCFAPGEEPRGDRSEFEAALLGISALRFDDFVSAFSGGPDFYGDADSFGRTGYHPRLPEGDRPIDQHTGFGQWHRFVFSDNSGVCVPPGAVIVEHGDIECRFSSCSSTPLNTFQKMGGLSNDRNPSMAPFLPKEGTTVMNTDFGYGDAIRGDELKMAGRLAAVAARGSAGGLLEFYNGCSPLLLAGDVNNFLEKASRDLDMEVLRDNFNNFEDATPEKVRARAALVARRLSGLRSVRPSSDLNLVNFASGKALPLIDLLVSLGLSVAPPERDFYGDIAAARLQVLAYPDPVLTTAFDELKIKWISPPAPYGLAATESWLRAIFVKVGRKPPRVGIGPSAADTARHSDLKKSLTRFAAGFIASPDEIPTLEGTWAVSGVPMFSFMREAGMPVRLFSYAPDRAAKALAVKEAELLAGRTGVKPRLSSFDSPAALRRALAADRALRIVYSDIPGDKRLAAAGKTDFSSSMCEPGYEGALETMRRLLNLCEWDFNERHCR